MVIRETPFSNVYLGEMFSVTRRRGITYPPVPTFYTKPSSIDDLADQNVRLMLDMSDRYTMGLGRRIGFKKE